MFWKSVEHRSSPPLDVENSTLSLRLTDFNIFLMILLVVGGFLFARVRYALGPGSYIAVILLMDNWGKIFIYSY